MYCTNPALKIIYDRFQLKWVYFWYPKTCSGECAYCLGYVGPAVKPDILYICTHSRGVVPEKTNWKKLEIFSNMFKISYKSVVLNKLK